MLGRTLFSNSGETIHLCCLPALKDIRLRILIREVLEWEFFIESCARCLDKKQKVYLASALFGRFVRFFFNELTICYIKIPILTEYLMLICVGI